jgi:hypothetical protein
VQVTKIQRKEVLLANLAIGIANTYSTSLARIGTAKELTLQVGLVAAGLREHAVCVVARTLEEAARHFPLYPTISQVEALQEAILAYLTEMDGISNRACEQVKTVLQEFLLLS